MILEFEYEVILNAPFFKKFEFNVLGNKKNRVLNRLFLFWMFFV